MMNKDEFLNDLRHALKGLPYEEVNKTLDYYSELIDDAVEDGADEKTFIAGLEDADTIAGRITDETSIRKLVAREVKGKRFSVPAIVLIIVGSPIWLSILIAVARHYWRCMYLFGLLLYHYLPQTLRLLLQLF